MSKYLGTQWKPFKGVASKKIVSRVCDRCLRGYQVTPTLQIFSGLGGQPPIPGLGVVSPFLRLGVVLALFCNGYAIFLKNMHLYLVCEIWPLRFLSYFSLLN